MMGRRWIKVCGLLWFLPVFIVAVTGCATQKPRTEQPVVAPPAVTEPQFVMHAVKSGETLATIAKWYTGKAGDWRELAQYNPDLKPGNLQVGQIVKVPLHMAIVHKAQPNYSTAPKKSRKAPRNPSSSVKQSEPDESEGETEEFFGPK